MNPGVVIVIVAILVVIMIHEAGHFFVAKAFGFKATKFFLGFGPRIWSIKRGETEYGIAAIPAGGYVKITGMNPYEEVAPEDQPRSYPNKPKWQRALVVLAGPATHWVVAFVLLLATVTTIGVQVDRPTNQVNSISVRTEGSSERTAAAEAGIRPDDRILAVDGNPTPRWGEISDFIRAHPGQRATLTIERDGEERDVDVHFGTAIFNEEGDVVAYAGPGKPIRDPETGEELVGFLGIEPALAFERYGFVEAIPKAAVLTGDFTVAAGKSIVTMFGEVFGGGLWEELTKSGDRQVEEDTLSGIVGFVSFAGDSFARGRLFELMSIIIGFTVVVGLMNLLPLPPLDGGHLAVLGIEAVTRRAVDIRKIVPVAVAVIAFFVVLFVAVLYLDIARPVQVDF